MKILHVIRRWKGGVGTYVREVSRELEKMGHEVKVISREDDLGIFSLFKSFPILKKVVEKEKADVIAAHDWSIALPLLGIKNLVVTFHGYEKFPKRIIQKFIEKKTTLVVLSKKMKKIFDSGHLIHSGVNLEVFKPSNKKIFREKWIKFIGFAQKPSSFYHFDKIYKSIEKKEDWKLLVAWEMYKKLKKVKCVGYLAQEKMPYFYSSLEAFISLPKRSGFNLVWLEAMACEIPTVGNYEGVGPELPIVHVKREEPREIAKAIETAIELKGKTNYRKWIKKKGFTWDNTAKKLLEVYEEVAR